MTKLSVNINKIATLRNSRGGNVPNLLKVARDIESFGARANSIKEEVFLGKTAGSIVKQTDIPVLAIPDVYKFNPINNILFAFN